MTPIKITLKSLSALALFGLLFLIAVISCTKSENNPTPVDKTALKKSIDSAQWYLDHTTEGTQPGEYVIGSKAPLQTSLNNANTVYANASATQSDVTNATTNLNAATTTYKGQLIQPIAAANLVAYWKFNGNANDSSGHGHNGTLTQGAAYYGGGMATPTIDRFGRANMAYHFDHGGNIDIPYNSALNPSQEMSISIWFKKDTAGRTINADTYTMMSLFRWLGFKFQLQSTNKMFYTVRVLLDNGDTTIYDRDDNVLSLNPETWYHGVVTFKSGEEDFYINGSLVYSWTNVPGTPISTPSNIDLMIGQDLPTSIYQTIDGDFQVAWGGFWTGDMDDVMLYNIALSATQVSQLYDSQKTQ